MRLLSLSLSSFKGAGSVTLDLGGRDATVYGANGVGKTTLADAWFWLLFGTDAQGQTKFEIKPVGSPNDQSEVEASLDLGPSSLTLKRAYREKWETTRGRSTKEFKGYTTDYWINGVPVQEKDYQARVASLCDAKTLRLLTDPLAFANQHWTEARKALIDLCGDVSDEDAIASKPSLAAVPKVLGGRSVDEQRKVLRSRREAAIRERDGLPIRIDEANKAIPTVPEGDWAKAMEDARAALAAVQDRRAAATSGGEVAALRVRGQEVQAELLAIANEVREAGDPGRETALAALRAHDDTIRDAEAKARDLATRLAGARREQSRAQADIDRLLADAKAEKAREHVGDSECPSCGQPLPEDRRQAAIEAFNAAKARRLEPIIAEGKRARAQLVAAEASVAALVAEEDAADLALSALRSERAHLIVPDAAAVDPATDPRYLAKRKERDDLAAQLARLQEGGAASLAEVETEARKAQERLDEASRHVQAIDRRKDGLARIETLKADEERLGVELEGLDRDLFLLEEFVRAKVALLDERVNGRFENVRFRLFETQVNGGLVECCKLTVGGVSYDGGLNTAAKVNAGLEVIDALAAKKDFAPPIFVDGAESVTTIRPTRGQQVRLVVSAADKALRVVVDGEPLPSKPTRKAKPVPVPDTVPEPIQEPEEALF